jgi:hypothetical protein
MSLRTSKRARALVLLTVQNATIGLLTRASRLGDPKDLYLPSSAVLFAEVCRHQDRHGRVLFEREMSC